MERRCEESPEVVRVSTNHNTVDGKAGSVLRLQRCITKLTTLKERVDIGVGSGCVLKEGEGDADALAGILASLGLEMKNEPELRKYFVKYRSF
jgi:hypothetical protein